MGLISSILATLVVLLLTPVCPRPTLANSQERRSGTRINKTREVDPLVAAQRRMAIGRLEAAGERAKSLDTSIMKVKILAKVADALWPHNEPRARQLFLLALKSIDGIRIDPKDDRRMADAQRRGGAFSPLFFLRSTVLQLLAQHDLKMAQDMQKAIEVENDDAEKKAALSKEEITQLRLDLAIALAKTKPEQSASLIRSFLPAGVTSDLIFALMRMRRESGTLADRLFGEALSLTRVRPLRLSELRALSGYILPTEEDLFFGNDPTSDPERLQVIQQFLDYVYSRTQETGTAAWVSSGGGEIDPDAAEIQYRLFKDLLPLFDRLQPRRAPFIRARMEESLTFMTSEEATTAEPADKGTVDDLVQQAESAIGERRRTVRFMRASAAALQEGDVERALSIAERIDNPYERKIQTSLVLYQTAMKDLRHNRLELAFQRARKIEFLPQRVVVFQRLAQKLWKEQQPDRARATVEELWTWLEKADNTPQKIDRMLGVTSTMADHDKLRAFELLGTLVKALNATDFSPKPVAADSVSIEVQITLDMLDLESVFSSLTPSDSERAFLLAKSLGKPEASLLAEAVVSQQVLRPR